MHAQHDRGVAPLHDAALPRLASLLDVARVEPRLRPLVGGQGALQLRVLKHAAGKRCVVAAEFAGGERAILKLYRKDRAVHHALVLRALSAALHGATRTPRLLDCWDDHGVLVQEWVPGDAVPDFESLDTHASILPRLGIALAGLHAAPVVAGPSAGLQEHVRRTCHGLQALADDVPELATSLRALESAMYESEARLAWSVRSCHGDYSPRQIFVHGAMVYLVDVDGMSQSDPALDVANFQVGLRAHLGERGVELGAVFRTAYLERAAMPELAGLPHYEALAWLRRALIAWRKRPPGWEEQLRASLDHGHRCLEL